MSSENDLGYDRNEPQRRGDLLKELPTLPVGPSVLPSYSHPCVPGLTGRVSHLPVCTWSSSRLLSLGRFVARSGFCKHDCLVSYPVFSGVEGT